MSSFKRTITDRYKACRRSDRLTAQRVEVAMVFQKMLGDADALEYLMNCGMSEALVARILGQTSRRRRIDGDVWNTAGSPAALSAGHSSQPKAKNLAKRAIQQRIVDIKLK
jgi:hypothetical protein